MDRTFRIIVGLGVLAGGIVAGLGLGKGFEPAPVQAQPAAVSGDLSAFQEALASVAEAVSPSVVHITTLVNVAGEGEQATGVGSGVVAGAEGHILTNHHVVEGAGARGLLRVRFSDGREVPAKVLGTDSETDLAVLKIDPRGLRLSPLRFADAASVKVGHLCLAVGSPFGLSNSVTMGTVSAKHRSAQLNLPYQDFIQTDAAINPGNSGGALVNIRGELIGINAAIVAESRGSDGVGFAIPSNVVRWVYDQLVAQGKVRRGFLGVKSLDFGEDLLEFYRERHGVGGREELLAFLGLKEPRGVVIFDMERSGPAAKAGIRDGDVLLEIGGKPVASQSDLLFKVAESLPGSKVAVKVLRDKKEREFSVELGERPPVDLRRRRR